MATMKNKMLFFFEVGGLTPNNEGEVRCDLCYSWFVYPDEVETILSPGAFTVCPTCAVCPEFAAMNAEKSANDKDRIAQRDEDPINRRDIRKKYLAIAMRLRGLKSFNGIPGAITARHLAAASAALKARRDAGKAA